MSLVFEFGIILAVCLAGELLHALLPLPVPASIYGLCLLLLLLLTGVVSAVCSRRRGHPFGMG